MDEKPNIIERKVYNKKLEKSPLLIIETFSLANAENVVNPPQNPVAINRL